LKDPVWGCYNRMRTNSDMVQKFIGAPELNLWNKVEQFSSQPESPLRKIKLFCSFTIVPSALMQECPVLYQIKVVLHIQVHQLSHLTGELVPHGIPGAGWCRPIIRDRDRAAVQFEFLEMLPLRAY